MATYDYTHSLNAIKGWPFGSVLDYKAKLDSSVLGNANAGTVVHLSSTGTFELGAQLTQMPIFLRKGATSLDVANPGGNDWTAIAPVGWLAGLVATGGYELATTEYNTADATYMVPNAVLHSPTEAQISPNATNAEVALAGQLCAYRSWPGATGTTLVLGTDNICGVVSRGIYTNNYGVSVLAFWPVYQPGTA